MKKMTKLETLCLTDEKLDKVVKIQGTPYDRKRKLSESDIRKMNKMAKSGKSLCEIASKFGVNWTTVRYNTDPIWRQSYNATRSGAHTGKDKISVKNRVAYKRSLVATGKVAAVA